MLNRNRYTQYLVIKKMKSKRTHFALFPESIVFFILAGILARLTFFGLPISKRNSGVSLRKLFKGLQLRVQLRIYTGFPF